jgi:hypothetical protein
MTNIRLPRHFHGLLLWGLSGVLLMAAGAQARASPVECRSVAATVKAVTDPDAHYVTTLFQFDDPNLQVLLSTSITVTGTGLSCIVAHLSGMARITDNYIVFQVRVDGVPMQGHLSNFGSVPTPVVAVLYDDENEQLYDPTKVVSYNFFQRVLPGQHLVEVMVAAGSGIDVTNYPTVSSPVLTLEYR